jgi:molybdate transport repressor ModE-like protein
MSRTAFWLFFNSIGKGNLRLRDGDSINIFFSSKIIHFVLQTDDLHLKGFYGRMKPYCKKIHNALGGIMKTGALIAASGIHLNIPDFDPTIRMGDTSIIKKMIITLQHADVDPIVVITGHNAQNIEKHLARMGVVFLRNDDYRNRDMFHAVQMGIDYLQRECGRIFVMPVDVPLFTSASLRMLLDGKKDAVCPVFNGKPGHPILLGSGLFGDILNYKGNNGLWGAVTAKGREVEYIDVNDEGILFELETEEDLLRMRQSATRSREPLRYSLQLKIGRNELVFGPGILQFLELVDRTGSMQTACRQMNISYSKGLKMIGLAEKETGRPLLERRAGGSEGGVSFLTEEGRLFVRNYIDMREELERCSEGLFEKYFGGGK